MAKWHQKGLLAELHTHALGPSLCVKSLADDCHASIGKTDLAQCLLHRHMERIVSTKRNGNNNHSFPST